jgi:hypothetical protein
MLALKVPTLGFRRSPHNRFAAAEGAKGWPASKDMVADDEAEG